MEPDKPHRHKTLQQLIDFQDIVYTYPAQHTRLIKQRLFVEDYYVGLDPQMMEEELPIETNIVEHYDIKKNPHAGFFNMVNDSSDNKELPERRDSSVQSFKIIMKNHKQFQSDSSESNLSNSSDFRRKSSLVIEKPHIQNNEVIQSRQDEILNKQSFLSNRPIRQLRITHRDQQKDHYQNEFKFQKQLKQQKDSPQILKQNAILRQEKIQKVMETGCNCKRSHCLKMYCQCFHLQIFCGNNCSCKGCGNLQKSIYHDQAVIQALARNPKAFEDQNPEACFKLNVGLSEVKKGCKCRKTKCLKKYCQCYNSGQKCGVFCKCEGCENIMQTQQIGMDIQT